MSELEEGRGLPQGSVIVVDDLPDVRKTIAGLIEDEGWIVCSASTREEAEQLFGEKHFDVAVFDVRLDESDEDNREGLDLMHYVNQLSPSTAVIILTAHADVKMVREALQPRSDGSSPASGFLEKTEWERIPDYIQKAYEKSSNIRTLQLLDLIASGENEQTEFKASLRWNYRSLQVDKNLYGQVIKAMTGFLNSKGGALLIGISDDGTVMGIENDIRSLPKQNLDGFQLALVSAIQSHIEPDCTELMHFDFEFIDEKCICVVDVEASPEPVFMSSGSETTFYVRLGNSTRKLNVKAATSYIMRNFPR